MYKFFVLSGASGAGKTTSLNALVESGLCEKVPKYSEREERGSSDDIVHVDNIDTNISCDVIYTMYNNKYGINTNQIKDRLKLKHQITVISDIMSLIELKKIFKDDVIIIYILTDRNIENFVVDYIEKNRIIISQEDKDRLFYLAHKIFNATEKYKWQELDDLINLLTNEFQHVIEKCDDFIIRYSNFVVSHQIYVNNKTLFDYLVHSYKGACRLNQCIDIIKLYS